MPNHRLSLQRHMRHYRHYHDALPYVVAFVVVVCQCASFTLPIVVCGAVLLNLLTIVVIVSLLTFCREVDLADCCLLSLDVVHSIC